ncbi:MAG: DNA alkylation repair protein [Bacteroidota bacterium]
MTADTTAPVLLRRLKSLGSRRNIEGMARFGITSRRVFGVGTVPLRTLGKRIGRNHALAQRLWRSGYLEARILAALIEDPALVTSRQMDRWAQDFDNWAVCDGCCSIVFDKTPFAYSKAGTWSHSSREFVKRAGYVMMAVLAVHDKRASDAVFLKFFPHIRRGATDNRNFVKKAVNWALRQIGKRNRNLNTHTLRLAASIRQIDSPAARWIAADAIRELRSKRNHLRS